MPLQIFGPRMATHTYAPKLGGIGVMLKDLLEALGAESFPVPIVDKRDAVIAKLKPARVTLAIDGGAPLGSAVFPLPDHEKSTAYNGFHRAVDPEVLRGGGN